MEAKDKFEALALANGWRFVHARRDYQNLTDALAFVNDSVGGYGLGETIFFLDPVICDGTTTDGISYSGNFMVLTKSDMDDTYENKYTKYIEPLKEVLFGSFKNNLRCSFEIKQWRAIEVINVFDINADGLSIQFNIKG